MQGVKQAWGERKIWVGIALVCTAAAVFFVVTVATGSDDDPDSPDGPSKVSSEGERVSTSDWVSTHERVLKHETLPCTGPEEPINFETFSAGPAVAGLPMTSAVRRCDATAPADEKPANYLTYVYGDCQVPPRSEAGCAPPLEIQTWPACQRNISGYSFNGKPLPYRELPQRGGATVMEYKLGGESRLEVYTKSSTVVIFTHRPELAEKAVGLLDPQEIGKPPARKAADLRGAPPKELAPPTDGAMEGRLKCQP